MSDERKTLYGMFADGDEAYYTWSHEAKRTLGYPPFHRWIYMTAVELWDETNPIDGSYACCSNCRNTDCAYRRDTCWSCVMPKQYVPSPEILKSREAAAEENLEVLMKIRDHEIP